MSTVSLAIRVECYAGQRGEEEPRRFWLGTTPVDVTEVLDRWLAPAHRDFQARGGEPAQPPRRRGPGPGPRRGGCCWPRY